jgi:hypothetical protein
MGKPYQFELQSLPQTYEWALKRNLASLSRLKEDLAGFSLYSIGSGGSLSAAAYGAYLHGIGCGGLSVALTPLEFRAKEQLRNTAVLIYSAGGGNVDVIAALRHAIGREANFISTMSLAPESKLASLSSHYQHVRTWAEHSPVEGDGFLATNSLLAFFVLSHRIFQAQSELPPTYERLRKRARYSIAEAQELVKREHLIVLHGPSTRAAAMDFESKMSEAGLSSVQLADYRNFAHGRHNWIAKKSTNTGVLSLCGRDDWEIGERTHRLLKGVCPVTIVKVDGPASQASLASLPAVFEITKYAGVYRQIDPGRPGVPAFGRQIYNLRPKATHAFRPGSAPTLQNVVDRKLNICASETPKSSLTRLIKATRTAHDEFRKSTYRALVLDFDDTLCGRTERFGNLAPDVVAELERLAACQIPIGIATGRGRSVRIQLRNSIAEKYWPTFTIGYYNCAEIASLSDDASPHAGTHAEGILSQSADLLLNDDVVGMLAKITVRPVQITLEPSDERHITILWREVNRCLAGFSASVKVVHSSRSVDVITSSTSKSSLIPVTADALPADSKVLCIGDQGRYPGNDFELLSHRHSLSSDLCSLSLSSCWNFAPVGYRGVQATRYYLQKLQCTRGLMKLRLPELR